MSKTNKEIENSSQQKSPDIGTSFDNFERLSTLINLLSRAETSIPSSSTNNQLLQQHKLMKITIQYIKTLFVDFEIKVNKQFEHLRSLNQKLNELLEEERWSQSPYDAITDGISKLRIEVSSRHKTNAGDDNAKVIKIRPAHVANFMNEVAHLPFTKFQGCKFQGRRRFEEFENNFESLTERLRNCLLCFAAFPEYAIVKKTFLMYWWIGEGFINEGIKDGSRTANQVTEEILKELLDKGFIDPHVRKRRLVGLSVHPLVRYAIIFLADNYNFLSFDQSWNPTWDISSSGRSCLVEGEDAYSGKKSMKQKNLEGLHSIINISDSVLDMKPEVVSKMKNIKFISLGRWGMLNHSFQPRDPFPFIDLDCINMLAKLENLQVVSFWGPHRDYVRYKFGKLTNLKVLHITHMDKYAFSNIQLDIEQQRNLTHLDVSGSDFCRISFKTEVQSVSSSNLQVLKGIHVTASVRDRPLLENLSSFKLKKLSIIILNLDNLTLSHAFQKMETLQKLSIEFNSSWMLDPKSIEQLIRNLPRNLEKIDLRNWPFEEAPFTIPNKLTRLQKMYIGGGTFKSLSQHDAPIEGDTSKWNVKVLRLKRLENLTMDWNVLREQFPELIYLEIVDCPNLTAFPCDHNGVWVDSEKLSQDHFKELGLTWSYLATEST